MTVDITKVTFGFVSILFLTALASSVQTEDPLLTFSCGIVLGLWLMLCMEEFMK